MRIKGYMARVYSAKHYPYIYGAARETREEAAIYMFNKFPKDAIISTVSSWYDDSNGWILDEGYTAVYHYRKDYLAKLEKPKRWLWS